MPRKQKTTADPRMLVAVECYRAALLTNHGPTIRSTLARVHKLQLAALKGDTGRIP
jgi:hypothetical protein